MYRDDKVTDLAQQLVQIPLVMLDTIWGNYFHINGTAGGGPFRHTPPIQLELSQHIARSRCGVTCNCAAWW